MPRSRKVNLFLILIGGLSGIPLSLIDDSFFDTERFLLVRGFFGGIIFSIVLCFVLNYGSRRHIRFGLDESVFDLTRPYNTFMVLGLVLGSAGLVCFLLSVVQQNQLLVPSFVFLTGMSFCFGSIMYVWYIRNVQSRNREHR